MRQLGTDHTAANAQGSEIRLVAEPLDQLDGTSRLDDQFRRAAQNCLGV
jgi:hypothetical protein